MSTNKLHIHEMICVIQIKRINSCVKNINYFLVKYEIPKNITASKRPFGGHQTTQRY